MKLIIDFMPLAAFLVAYQLGGIYPATATLVVSLWIALLLDWLLRRQLNKPLLFGAVVASVLGGMTFAFHNAAFIKLKPTIVYSVMAVVLLGSHFVGDRVILERAAHSTMQLPRPVWRKLNLAWAGFFAFCAALNLYVAQNYPEATWVKFKLVAFTALPFAFALLQVPFLMRYIEQPSTEQQK